VQGWLGRWLGRASTQGWIPGDSSWILVPLGNPGEEYAETRHNLGRLLLQRWAERRPEPTRIQSFKTGTLLALGQGLRALVPGTYMNLSGQVCAEAVTAGLDPSRIILLHDDKDLPLGLGRFRLEGSHGGHNGLRSVFDHLGTQAVPRLKLGIGPFTRPLDQFVLGSWTEDEWRAIEALDEPFGRFLEALASAQELTELPVKVNPEGFWSTNIH